LKSLQILEDALEATDRTGAVRRIPSREIAKGVARKLPDGPPFAGAIFLDLVPSAVEGPIRLLPATRVNYGVLPGAGSTSHENFRRLVRHLKA
jgi:hypothetical protein